MNATAVNQVPDADASRKFLPCKNPLIPHECFQNLQALRAEGVPVNTIAVNQVLDGGASRKFLASKRADQQRALQKLRSDPALRCGARPGTMSKAQKLSRAWLHCSVDLGVAAVKHRRPARPEPAA